MKRILNKLKPVALLLGMSIVSTFVVFVVNKSAIRSRSLEASATQESIQGVESPETSTVVDTSVPLELEVEEETGDEVLSVSTGIYNCSRNPDEFSYIQSDSYCVRTGEAEIHYTKDKNATSDGSGRVSVGAEIVLAEVTVPLELFSGIEVPDSNRQITLDKPTLKPAGEQIDMHTASILVPPGTKIWEYKRWDSDLPFNLDYVTAFFKNIAATSEENRIGVENELDNECDDCYNFSNPNPDKSNKLSEFIYDSVYRYPGEKDTVTEEEGVEECPTSDTYVEWNGEFEACRMSAVAQAIERVKRITDWGATLQNYIKCEIFNDPDCIDTEDIIVKMDSAFGTEEDCLRGSACTNAFMNMRSEVALAPSSSFSGKYYYLTPCGVYVQGLPDLVTVDCAWDMSHIFKERKVNEYDDLPTVDSTPTEDEYNEFLNERVNGSKTADQALPISGDY